MPGYNPQRRGTARTLPNGCAVLCILCCSMYFLLFCVFLCYSMYFLFCDVLCIFGVYMCTEQLPPGGYPIAVKHIISYQIISYHIIYHIIYYIIYHTIYHTIYHISYIISYQTSTPPLDLRGLF
jgi:hypothetical protein